MRIKKFIGAFLVFVVSAVASQDLRPVLTYESAKKIVETCVAYADERGWRLSIAVQDGSMNLLAFARMDGASAGTADIALWKADATAAFPIDTKLDAAAAAEFPALAAAPHVAIFEGGLAIFTEDGAHIGGVGVSGASGSQDAECAKAGIDAAGLATSEDNAAQGE